MHRKSPTSMGGTKPLSEIQKWKITAPPHKSNIFFLFVFIYAFVERCLAKGMPFR